MAYFRLLVAFLALLGAFPSWGAGYAQVTPPPGWGYDPVLKGLYKVQPTTTLRGGAATVEGLLSIGGKMVSVPSSLKFAPTAARAAAGLLWAYPPARVAVSVGGWIAASKIAGWAWDEASKTWFRPDAEDGFQWRVDPNNWGQGLDYYGSRQAACDAVIPWFEAGAGGTRGYRTVPWDDSGSWKCSIQYQSPPGSGSWSAQGGWNDNLALSQRVPDGPGIPATQQDFVDSLSETPMPVGVPLELPGDYPVESPRIVPLFTPMGDPVANPDYNDQLPDTVDNPSRLQDGVLIKPAPSASDPWQVEVTPWTRPVPGSMTDVRETQKLSDPSNPASDDYDERPPEPPPGGTSGGVNQSSDFCAKNPGVLACLKLDVGESPGKLPTKEIGEEFEPVGGWAGSASCPAPIVLSYFDIELSWTPLCDALVWLKPLILAMAWLSAAFILIGRGEA